jgi:hypothetical protein
MKRDDATHNETRSFPGGIADASGRYGFVNTVASGTVAIDLSTGREMWRSTSVHRPLLIIGERVAALRATPRGLQLVLLDIATGSEMLVSAPLPLPEWVRELWQRPDCFTIAAETGADALDLMWQARRGYEGGAPPSPKIEAQLRRSDTGQLRVDLGSGRVQNVKKNKSLPSESEIGTVMAVTLEGRVYELDTEPVPGGGMTRILLRSRDASSHTALWYLTIAEQPQQPPPPLRP